MTDGASKRRDSRPKTALSLSNTRRYQCESTDSIEFEWMSARWTKGSKLLQLAEDDEVEEETIGAGGYCIGWPVWKRLQ